MPRKNSSASQCTPRRCKLRTTPKNHQNRRSIRAVPSPVDSAIKAGVETERVGDMAYTLAQFNRLSAVLVARSEAATTQATESESAEATAGVSANRFADVAERRMKVLRSVKLVKSPGDGLEQPKERPAAPQQSPPAKKSLDASAAQLLEPAQRRLRELRAVERFIQTADLATAAATEQTEAVSLEKSEPASVTEPDLLSASATGASEEVNVDSGLPPAPNPAPTPLATRESPDAAAVTSELSVPLLQAEPQDDAVEPEIGTEVFAEIVQPMAQSDRPASGQATVTQEPRPAPVEMARPREGSQPQAQWSDEIEWPQQWRPDSGDNATVVPHDAEQQDIDDEPLAASEPAALENAVHTPADSAAARSSAGRDQARAEPQPEGNPPGPGPRRQRPNRDRQRQRLRQRLPSCPQCRISRDGAMISNGLNNGANDRDSRPAGRGQPRNALVGADSVGCFKVWVARVKRTT